MREQQKGQKKLLRKEDQYLNILLHSLEDPKIRPFISRTHLFQTVSKVTKLRDSLRKPLPRGKIVQQPPDPMLQEISDSYNQLLVRRTNP